MSEDTISWNWTVQDRSKQHLTILEKGGKSNKQTMNNKITMLKKRSNSYHCSKSTSNETIPDTQCLQQQPLHNEAQMKEEVDGRANSVGRRNKPQLLFALCPRHCWWRPRACVSWCEDPDDGAIVLPFVCHHPFIWQTPSNFVCSAQRLELHWWSAKQLALNIKSSLV